MERARRKRAVRIQEVEWTSLAASDKTNDGGGGQESGVSEGATSQERKEMGRVTHKLSALASTGLAPSR